MRSLFTKKALIIILILGALGVGVILVLNKKPPIEMIPTPIEIPWPTKQEIIGTSVEGRQIESYTFGVEQKHPQTRLLFVGGIHGGYEWNSVLLAYKFIDYLKENPDLVTNNLIVSVIPSANPDALFKVTGKEGRFVIPDVSTNTAVLESARFNAHDVDLNRNFDCKWKPESTWRSKVVSAGTAPFSEPEALAIRDFVVANKPDAVIFWHSQANAVYASECNAGILPVTLDIMNAYSVASGYTPVKSFDAYPISGDAEGWLASINIPAITVELKTHETIEWDKNLAGIKALFNYYSPKI